MDFNSQDNDMWLFLQREFIGQIKKWNLIFKKGGGGPVKRIQIFNNQIQ